MLAGAYCAPAQCPAPVPLSIVSLTTTESRCQASGSVTVLLSGGTAPYTYSITAGPVTAPLQSSNTFQSLAPGSYTLKVTDNCNTSLTTSFTVGGSYTVPQPTATLQPPACQGGNNGSIKIDITGGRPPYSYSLISPSPVTAPDQGSNLFTGLSGGIYTYRVSDSCGNYQTRTVVLQDGDNAPFYIQRGDLHYEGCDSFSIAYTLYPTSSPYLRPSYTAVLTLPNGATRTRVFNATDIGPNTTSVSDTFYFRYAHTSGAADNMMISASNTCGASYTTGIALATLDMAAFSTPAGGCSGQYRYVFDQGKDNDPSYPFRFTLHCASVTYTLVSPSGTVLATQLNNSSFTGFPPGNGYKVIREDCCRKDTLLFNWASMPALKINGYTANPGDVCKEGTTTVNISVGPVATGDIILASGPSSLLFADGSVHHYTYPDTIRNQPFGTTGVNISYFTNGTYKLYAVDGCGQRDSITFTITPSDLRHSTFSAAMVKGCTGANKIIFDAVSNTGVDQYSSDAYIYTDPAGGYYYPSASPYTDSMTNLSSGSWRVNYLYQRRNYYVSFLQGMDGYGCDMITDTLVIPSYTQPLFAPSAAIAACGPYRNIALLPDTTRGLAPYQYQVISGAVTTPLQPDPLFQNLSSGTYTFLVADACGNSYSSNISIDTLTVPLPVATGSTCQYGAATLRLPDNPFYSYTWQRPNGAIATGSMLTLDPVSPADTGTYTITVTSVLGGCTDSSLSTITLDYCSLLLLPVMQLHVSGARQGDNIMLQWQATDETAASYYMVERSADGKHFTAWQRVTASGPAMNTYTLTDLRPLPGAVYYRVQMVHTDGSARYSAVVSLPGKPASNPMVYPTLVGSGSPVFVSWPATRKNIFIQVVGMDGRVWLTRAVDKNITQTSIDMGKLPAGHYLVVFSCEGKKTATRVIKQ